MDIQKLGGLTIQDGGWKIPGDGSVEEGRRDWSSASRCQNVTRIRDLSQVDGNFKV